MNRILAIVAALALPLLAIAQSPTTNGMPTGPAGSVGNFCQYNGTNLACTVAAGKGYTWAVTGTGTVLTLNSGSATFAVDVHMGAFDFWGKKITPDAASTSLTLNGRINDAASVTALILQNNSAITSGTDRWIIRAYRDGGTTEMSRLTTSGRWEVAGGLALSIGGSDLISSASGAITVRDSAAAGTDGLTIDSVNSRSAANQNHLNIKSGGVSIFTFSGTTTSATFSMPGGVSIQNGTGNFSTLTATQIQGPNSSSQLTAVSRGTANPLRLGNDAALAITDKAASFVKSTSTEVASITGDGKYNPDFTDGSGTTGNQTINKPSFRAAFAAAATAITITDSSISTTSNTMCALQTADTTCTFIKSIVNGAGSTVITVNAGCNATTKVGCVVNN